MNYRLIMRGASWICLLGTLLLLSGCSKSGGGDVTPPPVTVTTPSYELSFWIDIDLASSSLRGYWYNVADRAPEATPPPIYIQNACQRLYNDYHPGKLYVIYHRQFELQQAEVALYYWKTYAAQYGMEVVPTVVLQSYANPQAMNFTNDELINFAMWTADIVNPDSFGIYDIETRDGAGTPQDTQLAALKEAIGDKLVMVGMQPGVALNASYKYAVQDTWTAECQGRTNDLWENPVSFNGTDIYGRKLLEQWVMERVDGDPRRFVWDMIPVAWDYDTDDALSYICPGDDQYKNDPPVPGRIALCHKYISACYANGISDDRFGGYSCDLHILEANSGGRGESPSFYGAMRTNVAYNGDFGATMREIGALYQSLAPEN